MFQQEKPTSQAPTDPPRSLQEQAWTQGRGDPSRETGGILWKRRVSRLQILSVLASQLNRL